MAETELAKIIPIVSLGILLTAAALAWSCESRTANIVPASVSINDIMLTVDTKSLLAQEMEDRTVVFSSANNR
jgi:hypothetical protein